MEEKLLSFARILAIKNDLLTLDIDELKEKYMSKDEFANFVESIYEFVSFDKSIFSFPNLREDVCQVFLLHRYDKGIEKDLLIKMNYVISTFNSLKTSSEEETNNAIVDFCTKEMLLRSYVFPDYTTLVESITSDIDIFISILDNTLEEYDNEFLVLATLNYFGNVFKEMYQDEEIKEVVTAYLEKVINKKGLFRGNIKKYSKHIKREFLE